MTEWSHPLTVRSLRDGPKRLHIVTDADQRAALARRFGLLAISACEADVTARAIKGGVAVTGRLKATATQQCVLSLEPVEAAIDADIALRYLENIPLEDGEEVVDPEQADDLERLEGDSIDIGEAAAQTLGLALDPFPRAADAEPPADVGDLLVEEARHGRQSPFAVLKNLRDKA